MTTWETIKDWSRRTGLELDVYQTAAGYTISNTTNNAGMLLRGWNDDAPHRVKRHRITKSGENLPAAWERFQAEYVRRKLLGTL